MSRPKTVLALTPGVGGYYFGEVLTSLRREIVAAGARLLVVQTVPWGAREDGTEVSDFDIPVSWAQVDGVVSVTTGARAAYLQRAREAGKPVVLVSTRLPDFPAPVATPDNAATRLAVEHLIGHGHVHIGFVGNLGQRDIADRYDAYCKTLADYGLSADPAHVFGADNNEWSGGEQAGRAVLAMTTRPTAFFVATDRNAIGLMRVLTAAGLAVPGDVAVVGFDNVEAAGFSVPALTSVNQSFDEVGALAGRMLLERMDGAPVRYGDHVPAEAVLAVRRSCGCGEDGRSPQCGSAGAPLALATLSRTLDGILPAVAAEPDAPARAAVLAAVERFERIVTADRAVDPGDLAALTESLSGLTPRPDLLRRCISALLCSIPPGADAAGAAQLSTALWQLQAGSFLQQAENNRAALEEQYRVDAGVVGGEHDPRRLRWLVGTHVPAALLATWADVPEAGRLEVVGVHDPHGRLPDLVGLQTSAETFPPPALLEFAGAEPESVCMVVPVASAERSWGLLAIVGEINTVSTLETYRHWATQLGAALQEQHLQEAVRASEERYALAARASNDGLWEWDLSTGTFYAAERCAELAGTGLTAGPDQMGHWTALIHPDDRAEVRQTVEDLMSGRRDTASNEYRVAQPDGSYRWVLSRALAVRSADGSPGRVVGSLSDIHDRRMLEEQLRASALHDALTGLPNRRLFLSRLEHALELHRRDDTPFAVLFLDLDGFKAINDSLGHQLGDRLLAAVGGRLGNVLRAVDTVARFGGDEFAVLLHDTGREDVLFVAERLQRALDEVIRLDGHEFVISASIGVASSEIDYACGEDVLRDADTAMYHAKGTDRGSIAFFDAAMHHNALRQLRLSGELRRAVEEQQFEVHYQPIVDLVTGRADRFEALVRWRHPTRGLVAPDHFLPLMIENGSIIRLGQWLVEEVCRHLAEWGPAVANVAINLSDREFWHDELLPHVLRSLERNGLTADRLTLEITEGVVMNRPEAASRRMAAMHDAGFELHIDDFGTGYSSLDSLHRFPVHALKVDRSFVAGIGRGDHSDELVRAIIAMGTALGLATVAEGVETDEQIAFLRGVGCVTAQGYRFSPAMPAESVPQWLACGGACQRVPA